MNVKLPSNRARRADAADEALRGEGVGLAVGAVGARGAVAEARRAVGAGAVDANAVEAAADDEALARELPPAQVRRGAPQARRLPRRFVALEPRVRERHRAAVSEIEPAPKPRRDVAGNHAVDQLNLQGVAEVEALKP